MFRTFVKTLSAFLLFTLAAQANEKTQVLVLGDSLTEGYGVSRGDAYPAILQELVTKAGHPEVTIINAGIAGSTSASAVPRIKWQLKNKPAIIILALGANDGLRGLKPEDTRKNLSDSLAIAKENQIKILLVGMLAPPNYGKEYTRKFQAIFPELAKKYQVPLIPFLLENVAGESSLNQPDGIHPNEKGHQALAKNVLKHLLPLL